ncbi:MAG: putative PEP-binding protein, partial [Candidatus Poseidoniia archaeon]
MVEHLPDLIAALNALAFLFLFLGWRAIRFCLDHKEIFLPQLKAILRANQFGNLKILLPMVSSLEEIEQFQDVFQEAQKALKAENQSFNP